MAESEAGYGQTQDYILIAENENEDPVEIPAESDGSILLSTLEAQFPGACGLKYRNVQTQNMRALRVVDRKLRAPDDGWAKHLYIVVYPKGIKRKVDKPQNETVTYNKKPKTTEKSSDVKHRIPDPKCCDLLVMGLPWEMNDDGFREYFGKFGEVILADVKYDRKTKKSKGYGFIKFADYGVQKNVMSKWHRIGDQWCQLKIPESKKAKMMATTETSNRVFLGRVSESLTTRSIRKYFEKFGVVSNVYLPKPYRPFGFVTFESADVAAGLCGQDHLIDGCSVLVSSAEPRENTRSHRGHEKSGWGSYDAEDSLRGADGMMSDERFSERPHDSGPMPGRHNGPPYSRPRGGSVPGPRSGPMSRPRGRPMPRSHGLNRGPMFDDEPGFGAGPSNSIRPNTRRGVGTYVRQMPKHGGRLDALDFDDDYATNRDALGHVDSFEGGLGPLSKNDFPMNRNRPPLFEEELGDIGTSQPYAGPDSEMPMDSMLSKTMLRAAAIGIKQVLSGMVRPDLGGDDSFDNRPGSSKMLPPDTFNADITGGQSMWGQNRGPRGPPPEPWKLRGQGQDWPPRRGGGGYRGRGPNRGRGRF